MKTTPNTPHGCDLKSEDNPTVMYGTPDITAAEKAWERAAKVTWTAADWQTFYWHLTAAFMLIATRHEGNKPCK